MIEAALRTAVVVARIVRMRFCAGFGSRVTVRSESGPPVADGAAGSARAGRDTAAPADCGETTRHIAPVATFKKSRCGAGVNTGPAQSN